MADTRDNLTEDFSLALQAADHALSASEAIDRLRVLRDDVDSIESPFAALTVNAEAPADQIDVGVQATSRGVPLQAAEEFLAELFDEDMAPNDAGFNISVAVGTPLAGDGTARVLFRTTSAGLATLACVDTAPADTACRLRVTSLTSGAVRWATVDFSLVPT